VKIFRDREKGVEIIERAIRHDPYHKRVPDALMLIGDARLKSRWYSEAKRVYARIAEEHPKSTLRPRAEYKAVLAESKAVEDVAYDTSSCEAIERKCKRLKAKNKGEMAKKAENLEDAIRNRRARKDFEIAEFYRKAGRRVAALTYYKLVAKNFKGTESAKRASECVAKLSGE
jgi:outer membrane protein assembly factor BamD (BamD/ComL family)